MALVAPGMPCGIAPDHDLEVLSVCAPVFGEHPLHDGFAAAAEESPAAVFFLDPLVHFLSGILAEQRNFPGGGAHGRVAIETALVALLSVFIMRYTTAPLEVVPGKGPVRRRLDRVLEFMAENLSEPQTLDQWARVANVSRFHFAKQFRSETGLPPYEFLLHLRVAGACGRLLAGEDSMAVIAGDLGFADQSHFHRHFRRLLGMTPGRFARLLGMASART